MRHANDFRTMPGYGFNAVRKLARLRAKAESSVATILKNWSPGDARDSFVARESDWRVHRKSIAIPRGTGLGGKDKDGLQWCEDPAAIGLRFVGFADEIAGRSINHRGWFTDSNGDGETYRGAVYQFPARDGVARYVAGYRVYNARGRSCGDMDGAAARLELDVIKGDSGRESSWDDDSVKLDAARAADGHAESDAEISREYNDAWQVAWRWRELASDMQTERAAAQQLVADMRKAIKAGMTAADSICRALRAQIRAHADAWEQARAERESIADDFAYWPADRSARLSVAEFAAANF